jgi:hypothetical protein
MKNRTSGKQKSGDGCSACAGGNEHRDRASKAAAPSIIHARVRVRIWSFHWVRVERKMQDHSVVH